MGATVEYKNNTIATLEDTDTKTLLTSGMYCEDNIKITTNGGGGEEYITTLTGSTEVTNGRLYFTGLTDGVYRGDLYLEPTPNNANIQQFIVIIKTSIATPICSFLRKNKTGAFYASSNTVSSTNPVLNIAGANSARINDCSYKIYKIAEVTM